MWQFIDALKLSQHFKVPLGGEPLNDSLEMTSITQHTWQRCIWQPILLLEASSPSPNSCLHVCSSHFSLASCLSLEMGRGRHCVPLQQSKCCSRTLCGQVLETAKIQRAVRLLTRRDAAGKICWLHDFSSLQMEWTKTHGSWGAFPVSWDYSL